MRFTIFVKQLDKRQCLFTGLDYWTHPNGVKWPFPAFFSVGEKLIIFIQPTSLLNLLP